MQLVDTLQICSITGRSGTIKVAGVSSSGEVFMKDGRVVHCVYADLKGQDALYRLLEDDNIELSFHEGVAFVETTVHLSLDHILLEAARRRDEAHEAASKVAWGRMITVSGAVQEVFLLMQSEISVGRAESCEICISNPTISSKHAFIRNTEAGVVLQDNGSMNGTYIDGEQVRETFLKHGDLIQFGGVYLRFETEFDPEKPSKPNALRETMKINVPGQTSAYPAKVQ